jgi:hypothetical protein
MLALKEAKKNRSIARRMRRLITLLRFQFRQLVRIILPD